MTARPRHAREPFAAAPAACRLARRIHRHAPQPHGCAVAPRRAHGRRGCRGLRCAATAADAAPPRHHAGWLDSHHTLVSRFKNIDYVLLVDDEHPGGREAAWRGGCAAPRRSSAHSAEPRAYPSISRHSTCVNGCYYISFDRFVGGNRPCALEGAQQWTQLFVLRQFEVTQLGGNGG